MINASKLSRDFSISPLKRGEKPTKEDLIYLSIDLNLSRKEIGEFFGVSENPPKRWITFYSIQKPAELYHTKVQKTNLKKYGCPFPLQSKTIRDKAISTNKSLYGVENPFSRSDVQDTIKNTNLSRYGATNPQQCEAIREKTQKSIQETFGVDYATQSPIVVAKIKRTNQSKLGVDYPLQSSSIKDKIYQNNIDKHGVGNPFERKGVQDKIRATNLDRYGFENAIQNPDVFNKARQTLFGLNGPTNPEISFSNKLITRGVKDISYQFCISGCSFDIKAGNVLIEINPTETHNSTINFSHLIKLCKEEGTCCSKHKLLSPSNHINKWRVAKDNGYELITLFDWMDIEKTADFIASKTVNNRNIMARKCEIREVATQDTKQFLVDNHVMGWENSKFNLGLYYNNELLSLMTFGKPRFDKRYEWELLRFATVNGTIISGGASKLFKHFLKIKTPSNCVTYSNNNLGTGKLYSLLGFNNVSLHKPSSMWINIKNNRNVRHVSLIMQGADRLLPKLVDNYFHVGLDREDFVARGGKEEYKEEYFKLPSDTDWWPNNSDILKHYGFVQVFDCGSTKWGYNKFLE